MKNSYRPGWRQLVALGLAAAILTGIYALRARLGVAGWLVGTVVLTAAGYAVTGELVSRWRRADAAIRAIPGKVRSYAVTVGAAALATATVLSALLITRGFYADGIAVIVGVTFRGARRMEVQDKTVTTA